MRRRTRPGETGYIGTMAQQQALAPHCEHGAAHRVDPVRVWLFAVAALVFVMVSVGGATRLTGSGLSITEWQPIMGAIPPLSDAAWQEALEKYRQIPQYQHVNKGMSLEAFKRIFWWEWSHRFLARFVGVAFLVPFLFFLATGRIARPLVPKLAGLFVLGGLQGAIGWYMVASGLSERVSVSQYRLAVHLSLAIVIFAGLLWIAHVARASARRRSHRPAVVLSPKRRVDRWPGVPADRGRRIRGRAQGRQRLQHLAADGWPICPATASASCRPGGPTCSRTQRPCSSTTACWPTCSSPSWRGTSGRCWRAGRAAPVRDVGDGAAGAVVGPGRARHLDAACAGAAVAGAAHQAGAVTVFGLALWHLHALRHGLTRPRSRWLTALEPRYL